jgi:hypothetical protein
MSGEMTNLLLGLISGVLLAFVGAYLSSFFERRRERRGKVEETRFSGTTVYSYERRGLLREESRTFAVAMASHVSEFTYAATAIGSRSRIPRRS